MLGAGQDDEGEEGRGGEGEKRAEAPAPEEVHGDGGA